MKPCDTLSLETLAAIYAKLPTLKAWIADVEEYVQAQALAGKHVPGYKLVAGRSVRKWQDEGAVVQALFNAGYDATKVFKQSLIGIGDAERLLGKNHELIARLAVKAPGKPTLVPESDPRGTFTGNSAGDDFN